jgi:hypothetical protein
MYTIAIDSNYTSNSYNNNELKVYLIILMKTSFIRKVWKGGRFYLNLRYLPHLAIVLLHWGFTTYDDRDEGVKNVIYSRERNKI